MVIYTKVWTLSENAIGQITQLLQSLDRILDSTRERVLSDFDSYIQNCPKHPDSTHFRYLGVFPRHTLSVFKGDSLEDSLSTRFRTLGLDAAADALHAFYGISTMFSNRGEYFISKAPSLNTPMYSQVGIADRGNIIFNFASKKDTANNMMPAPSVIQCFDNTLQFSENLYKEMGYSGMVDIVTRFSGTNDMQWVASMEEDAMLNRLLHGRAFYEDEILVPLYSIEVDKIVREKDKLYGYVWQFLNRNSREIPWS